MVAISTKLFLLSNLALLASAAVLPRVPAGTQFVTGLCSSDAECETSCCAKDTGRCAGQLVAKVRFGGCGFGAPALTARSPAARGTVPITLPCTNDAECDSGCCGKTNGKCSGRVLAGIRFGGCGGSTLEPNSPAAPVAPVAPVAPAAPAVPATRGSTPITFPCTNDAECDSGCCGKTNGKCSGRVLAGINFGGCGGPALEPESPAAPAAPVVPVAPAAPTVPAARGSTPITLPCTNDAECDSGCCGKTNGKCSGRVLAGINFGGCGGPALKPRSPAAPGSVPITLPCTTDAECDSGCCGKNNRKCSGRILAGVRFGGCTSSAAPRSVVTLPEVDEEVISES